MLYLYLALAAASLLGFMAVLWRGREEEQNTAILHPVVHEALRPHVARAKLYSEKYAFVLKKSFYYYLFIALRYIEPWFAKLIARVESRLVLLVNTVKGKNLNQQKGAASIFLQDLATARTAPVAPKRPRTRKPVAVVSDSAI